MVAVCCLVGNYLITWYARTLGKLSVFLVFVNNTGGSGQCIPVYWELTLRNGDRLGFCVFGGLQNGGKQSVPLEKKNTYLVRFLRLRLESEERSAQKFYYRAGDEPQELNLEEQKEGEGVSIVSLPALLAEKDEGLARSACSNWGL